MYSVHYIDVERSDGTSATKQVKRFVGNLKTMSERAARREHAKIMEQVNLERDSIAPAPKGQSFADAVAKWRSAIAPNLSPSTVLENHFFAHTSCQSSAGLHCKEWESAKYSNSQLT
jgi:hypothetical protein